MEYEAENKFVGGIASIFKTNFYYEISYKSLESGRLYILKDNLFKFYMSPSGIFHPYPKPNKPDELARLTFKSIHDYEYSAYEKSYLEDFEDLYKIQTGKITIIFDKIKGTMEVYDKTSDQTILSEAKPLSYSKNKATQVLKQNKDEHFFGGGMQNGRFAHKGKLIDIVNSLSWVDGGVTSPNPFYWSSSGYGVLRNTWQPGQYNFGAELIDDIKTTHNEGYFDAFFFIYSTPKKLFYDYYELTGFPKLLPEYAFYQAHFNTFNRDFWVKSTPETSNAILFEDEDYYKCYQPKDLRDRNGILESINGENNNYQFSARGMIDRYRLKDMPLGWFIPNDGYGSGYGQTDSLDGDIKNLTKFAEYAKACGVSPALWTESRLRPDDPQHPKKGERDLAREVGEAGVVALKCDVAWIGSGYSFGLNAIEIADKIFIDKAKHNERPMILTVCGWAGTQRYAGIWSGDQKGGEWEYIRFHIPTYIGAGLSGLPNVGSDMDGIYAGNVKNINIRDYQWKTFTPLQLNMDGWGSKQKTPFSYDKEATNINKAYAKLKSMLMPYNYTIAEVSTVSLPMIRAMFLEFPDDPRCYTTETQYQFMWGPSFLVAPVYTDEQINGESVRRNIYLPDPNQIWVNFLTGKKYKGGQVIETLVVPLWQLPVFVKEGAIIPMTNPNNNPGEIRRNHRIFQLYPKGENSFKVYEDDGITLRSAEKKILAAITKIVVTDYKYETDRHFVIQISPTTGTYPTMVKERTTEIWIMAAEPINVKMSINGESFEIRKVVTEEEYIQKENIYLFKKDFIVNPYLKDFGGELLEQNCLLIKVQKVDVTLSIIDIKVTVPHTDDIIN